MPEVVCNQLAENSIKSIIISFFQFEDNNFHCNIEKSLL